MDYRDRHGLTPAERRRHLTFADEYDGLCEADDQESPVDTVARGLITGTLTLIVIVIVAQLAMLLGRVTGIGG